jgi:CO dehydrogenase/acetyl-CoA synthase beta subunit
VQLEKDGIEDLFDKIPTEEDAEEPDKLVEVLQEKGHPALEMDPIF